MPLLPNMRQSLPPNCAGGESHSRDRSMRPPPQVTGQLENEVHRPQLPLTKNVKNEKSLI